MYSAVEESNEKSVEVSPLLKLKKKLDLYDTKEKGLDHIEKNIQNGVDWCELMMLPQQTIDNTYLVEYNRRKNVLNITFLFKDDNIAFGYDEDKNLIAYIYNIPQFDFTCYKEKFIRWIKSLFLSLKKEERVSLDYNVLNTCIEGKVLKMLLNANILLFNNENNILERNPTFVKDLINYINQFNSVGLFVQMSPFVSEMLFKVESPSSFIKNFVKKINNRKLNPKTVMEENIRYMEEMKYYNPIIFNNIIIGLIDLAKENPSLSDFLIEFLNNMDFDTLFSPVILKFRELIFNLNMLDNETTQKKHKNGNKKLKKTKKFRETIERWDSKSYIPEKKKFMKIYFVDSLNSKNNYDINTHPATLLEPEKNSFEEEELKENSAYHTVI